MKFNKRLWMPVLAVALVGMIMAGIYTSKALRLWNTAKGFNSQIRYLIESGQTIGEAPAAQTFSLDYLTTIFQDNPTLLEKLKGVVGQGLAETPALSLGEVSALIVTFHKNDKGDIEDVVVHAFGGFGAARAKTGFHRNGYFFQQIDRNLWNMGNVAIGFLGRDLILFSGDEKLTQTHQALLDAVFAGNIDLLVEDLKRPLYFNIVLPDPQRVVPPQLRSHIQAVVIRGNLAWYNGRLETLFITPSPRSSSYVLNLVNDMKTAAELSLKTSWKGVVEQTEWGPRVNLWWAHEMLNTMENATLEKDLNIVRMKTTFERPMVNAILKSMERMSRDLAQMRGSLEERLDPRIVDARLRTQKPSHYWSDRHQWGPDWPIPPPFTNGSAAEASAPATSSTSAPPATPTAQLSPPATAVPGTLPAPEGATAPPTGTPAGTP